MLKLWIQGIFGYEHHGIVNHSKASYFKLLQLISLSFAHFAKVSIRLNCSDTITRLGNFKSIPPGSESWNPNGLLGLCTTLLVWAVETTHMLGNC